MAPVDLGAADRLDQARPTALGVAAARHVDAAAERARLVPTGLPLLDVPAVTDPDRVTAVHDEALEGFGS